jgi:DNA/RNA-binding domain of Phe-tRNA-synthetase-like protein
MNGLRPPRIASIRQRRGPCDTQRMARFRYDPAVLQRFPAVVGGVIHATGVTNGPTPPDLAEAFDAESIAVRARIGKTPLSELPTLAAWRRVFREFGVDPTQYRSAAEALLRRLTKQGELPSIGTLVDLANLVSIRHALPVAVFDQRALFGGMTVRFARGDERWVDLGSSATEHPEPGEVIFADEADVVSARRWCWRQSAASAVRLDTTEILVTVEGHHETASGDVARALAGLQSLLGTYAAPATIRGAILSSRTPSFE